MRQVFGALGRKFRKHLYCLVIHETSVDELDDSRRAVALKGVDRQVANVASLNNHDATGENVHYLTANHSLIFTRSYVFSINPESCEGCLSLSWARSAAQDSHASSIVNLTDGCASPYESTFVSLSVWQLWWHCVDHSGGQLASENSPAPFSGLALVGLRLETSARMRRFRPPLLEFSGLQGVFTFTGVHRVVWFIDIRLELAFNWT